MNLVKIFKTSSINKFIIASASFFFVLILSTGLTLINQYLLAVNLFLIWLFFISLLFLFSFFQFINKFNLAKLSIIIISLIAFFSSFFFFSEYNFEGGHDPGVYFENAIYIAQNHKFSIDSSSLIPATYPGILIFKDHLAFQFPPAYPIVLSFFYYFLSITGIKLAISIFFVYSILALYFLVSALKISKLYSVVLPILFVFNYYTIIIFRSTYVENFFLVLVLASFLFIIKSLENKNYLFLGFLSTGLMTMVRPEGILNFIIYFIFVFLILIYFKKYKKINFKYAFLSLVMIFITLLILTSYNLNTFNYLSKNISDVLGRIISIFTRSPGQSIETRTYYNPYLFNLIYIYSVFNKLGFVFINLTSLILFFIVKKEIRLKILLLSLIILPQFTYLFNAEIANYLPWFVRRIFPNLFIFSLITFVILFSQQIIPKKIKLIIFSSLLIINLIPITKIFFIQEKGVMDFINKLDDLPLKKDIPIIFLDKFGIESYAPNYFFIKNKAAFYDRLPLSEPDMYNCIFSKSALAYIISSQISPQSNFAFFNKYLSEDSLVYKFSYSTKRTSASCDLRNYVVNQKYFTSYSNLINECSYNNPPVNTTDTTNQVFVYQINIDWNSTNKKCDLKNMSKYVYNEAMKEYKTYIK